MGPFRPEDLPVESLRISPLNAKIKNLLKLPNVPKMSDIHAYERMSQTMFGND